LGTERPEVESAIIPSTWREVGIGVFGSAHGISYRAYVVNGFDGVGGGSSKATGFSAEGLRNGRQKGSKAVAEDFAFVGRLDYEGIPGLLVGMSGYVGNAGQGNGFSALTTIVDGHADVRYRGLEFRGLVAFAHVDDANRINAANGYVGTASVGEDLLGFYLQAGYDVLHVLPTEQEVVPYVAHEWMNTQYDVPAGFSADPANDQQSVTIGVSYKPILNIVVKTDYQFRRNHAGTGVDQLNVALGYLF